MFENAQENKAKEAGRWANQSVEEQELLLECIYFSFDRQKASFQRLIDYVKLFNDQAFGQRLVHIPIIV